MHGTLYRVLPGTHGGTPGYSRGTVRRRVRYVAASGRGRATQCRAVCGAPLLCGSTSGRQGHSAVLTGTPCVLIRYLQSTHGVRTRLLRIPPRTRIPFGWSLHWAVHGSARHPGVGLVMGRQLSSTHTGTPRYFQSTHRVLTGTHMRSSGWATWGRRFVAAPAQYAATSEARLGPDRYDRVLLIDLPSRRRGTDCACAAAPTTAVPTTAAPTWSPTTATPTVSGAHSPVSMR